MIEIYNRSLLQGKVTKKGGLNKKKIEKISIDSRRYHSRINPYSISTIFNPPF